MRNYKPKYVQHILLGATAIAFAGAQFVSRDGGDAPADVVSAVSLVPGIAEAATRAGRVLRAMQGTPPYVGKDTYANVVIREGTVLYSLTPGAPPGFAVTGHTLRRTFASGVRNPVGLAFHPGTGVLWATVVERDGLGDEVSYQRVKNGYAAEVWKELFDAGVYTNPVTPPAVPENSCRLRISMMALPNRSRVRSKLAPDSGGRLLRRDGHLPRGRCARGPSAPARPSSWPRMRGGRDG